VLEGDLGPVEGIGCSYCGGRHQSATEVRACWERSQQAEVEPGLEFSSVHPQLASEVPEPLETSEAPGLNLVIGDGTGAVPIPWDHCEVVTVDPEALGTADRLVDRLLELAHTRTSIVLRLPLPAGQPSTAQPSTGQPPAETEERPPFRLSARFRFTEDLAWHLVWSNAVDGRDPARPRFAPVERALALGARDGAGSGADVVLPDGTPAFCDGGPVRFWSGEDLNVPGAVVLHRVALEHGSLTPFAGNATAADLAPDQLAAVTHVGGGARVIAPAGSGKTRVLTERARHLLRNWRLPGSAVCLVAFNKRAAEEMRERTVDLPDLQVRTLNSLALAIVNGSPPFRSRRQRRNTIDEPEVRSLLDKLVDMPRRANTDPAAAWIEALSAIRLGLRDPTGVEDEYGGDVDGLTQVFDRYRSLLADRGVVDFDDQVYGAVEALLTEPDTRAAVQRHCRLLLVDELQDLTPAHVLLIRLAAGPDGAVFGVGDDDQTIYGYAGASPEWLLRFADLFPGAGSHALEVNYRCPPPVVAATDRLLRRNRQRVAKSIRPAADRAAAPHQLQILTADENGANSTTSETTGHVLRLVEDGAPPDHVAVLSRVNASLVAVQVSLARAGVPVQRVLDEGWLERTGVRASLAWLRLASEPNHLAARDVTLAARRPPRALSPRAVEWMGEQGSVRRLEGLAERLNGRDSDKVAGFAADVGRLAAMIEARRPAADVLTTLRDEVGLDQAMRSLEGARRRVDRSAQTDDLDALVALAGLHTDATTFESWLREELRRPGARDGVVLATVHSVKGREWPHVVVHEATAGLMPHRLATDVEEERRVFHVAITRGIESVAVVAGEPPSPFVAELFRDPADDPPPRPSRQEPAARPSRPEPAGPPSRRPSAPAADETPAAARARQLLREWRRQRAAADAKPAFTVFADTTLEAIATVLPASLDELGAVKGIGPAKLERFGDEILAVVEQARGE
jgi:DNA helicase II / ATP-dependent DNA helicase PcrA